jgi:hypothetical protein
MSRMSQGVKQFLPDRRGGASAGLPTPRFKTWALVITVPTWPLSSVQFLKASEPQRRGSERGRHWTSSRRKVAFRSAKGRSCNQASTGRETIDRHLTAEDHELGLNAKQPLPPRKTPFFRGAKDDNAPIRVQAYPSAIARGCEGHSLFRSLRMTSTRLLTARALPRRGKTHPGSIPDPFVSAMHDSVLTEDVR